MACDMRTVKYELPVKIELILLTELEFAVIIFTVFRKFRRGFLG